VTSLASRLSPLPSPTPEPPNPGCKLPASSVGRRSDSEGERERFWRIGRVGLVGVGGSLLDVGILSFGIRWLELDPTFSRLVALISSGLFAFFASRSFAFRAQAGNIARQARLFVVAEATGLALDLVVFRLLLAHASFMAPEIVSQLANFLVFVAFIYPVRALVVFRVPLSSSEGP
jgi:putative flippase GtrA